MNNRRRAARALLGGLLCLLSLVLAAAPRSAVIVKDTPALHQNATLSVDGWFFIKEVQPGQSGRLVSKYDHLAPTRRGWELVLEQGDKLAFRVNCLFPNGGQQDFQLESAESVPRGRWVYLAGIFADEGNGLRTLYVVIDGRQCGKLSLPLNVSINPNSELDIFASVYSGSYGSQADILVDDLRISGAILPFRLPDGPADPSQPGTLALFSFDGPVYTAPGMAAGVAGEPRLVPGRFGRAMDLTGEVDQGIFKQALAIGREARVEDGLYGDFRLMVHTHQSQAELQLFQTEGQPPRQLALELSSEATGQVVFTARQDIAGSAVISIPLAGLADGNYAAKVRDATGTLGGELVRRLRLQRPLPLALPAEPVKVERTLIFPVDEFHFAKREGVVNRVRPPEIVMTTQPMDAAHAYQWAGRPDWFSVTSKGVFQMNYAAAADWGGKGMEYFHASSSDGVHWQTAPGLVPVDNSVAQEAYPLPSGIARPNWYNRAPFDESQVPFYSPQEHGQVPLNGVRMACIAPHIGNAAAKGLVNWGTYPVWERRKGEWIVLTKEPACVAKFGFTETELESPLDANDNFGGQIISDDGKTIYYYQAAKLHCYPPRAVPYDNIADSFRLMRVFSSTDGFHWKVRAVAPPDERDHPTLQHYGMTTLRAAADFRIGLLCAYNVEKQQIYSELMYSRDAIEWRRLDDRTPFLANTETPGSDFFGMIFPDLQATPIYEYQDDFYLAMGSRWHQRPHFYFCYSSPSDDPSAYDAKAIKSVYGNRQLAQRWPFFQAIGGWEGLAADYRRFPQGQGAKLGYAKFPRHRWIAVTAENEGTLTSRLWTAPARTLWLNGNGDFTVELQDAAGKPIPGYSGASAARFKGDSVNRQLAFGTNRTLPQQPFRAIIKMRQAQLFTLEIK